MRGWELRVMRGFEGWEMRGCETRGWEMRGWETRGWELRGWETRREAVGNRARGWTEPAPGAWRREAVGGTCVEWSARRSAGWTWRF
jgi:hypothetical protein